MQYAHGTANTCSAQGFSMLAGIVCVCIYNCSICLYYLAIIRYNHKDDSIKKKFEPWFHGIAIIVSLSASVLGLEMDVFHPSALGSVCYAYATPYEPPHCDGYEYGDIPDGFQIAAMRKW